MYYGSIAPTNSVHMYVIPRIAFVCDYYHVGEPDNVP